MCACTMQALAERDGEVTALKARVRGTESELQRLTVSLGAQQRQVLSPIGTATIGACCCHYYRTCM
jgi:hypothetical protein